MVLMRECCIARACVLFFTLKQKGFDWCHCGTLHYHIQIFPEISREFRSENWPAGSLFTQGHTTIRDCQKEKERRDV